MIITEASTLKGIVNDFTAEIIETVRNEITALVQQVMEDYIAEDEECWDAIHHRVQEEIRERILINDKKELYDEFIRLKQECMIFTPNKTLEAKLDGLAKNMDALYLEIQALKNDRLNPTQG